MERDFDLIRKLLIFFEQRADHSYVEVPEIEGDHTESKIKYHLVLMYQAGLLSCEAHRSSTSERVISVLPFDLTWDGHEFLAKIRSEGTWAKIKDTIQSRGGAVAFGVINQLATKVAMQAMGLAMEPGK